MEQILEKLEKIDERNVRIESKIDKMQVDLDKLNKENEQLKADNKAMRTKITEQEVRIEILERQARRKNIVIQGVEENQTESEQETINKIKGIMKKIGVQTNLDEELVEMRRIGRQGDPQNVPRPIILEMKKEATRMEILKAAKNLRGTKIYINEDFPKKILQERKHLLQLMKMVRQEGHTAALKYNKLWINGEPFSLEQLEGIDVNYWKKPEEKKGNARTINDRSPISDNIDPRGKLMKMASKN
ncbi:uncharacterized protein [Diabrotica undecimpunctata]|uniref:uncharacterized protein n=2 Tax=Diabrotica undecimpunctata TaxID=50387 RepID=UPI003B631CA0